MDTPICFSYNFTNKKNIRSFSNVLNFNCLKEKDNKVFIEYLLEDNNLVSEICIPFLDLMDELKQSVRTNCKQDFKQYFPQSMYSEKMKTVDKEDIFLGCIKALQDIIPKRFFGRNHNYKIFRKLVHTIIYSMSRQHIFHTTVLKDWDMSVFPWQTLPSYASNKILSKILLWIMKYILSAIISLNFYVTTCKIDSDETKLYFFKKEHWQSFFDKTISNMVLTKVITRYEQNIVGKTGKNFNLQERLRLKILRKKLPKLHLILKPRNNYRVIVCYKNGHLGKEEQIKIREKLTFLKMLTGKIYERIEKQFEALYRMWVLNNKPKLYFIKTDLSNAFGSIHRDKLLKILYERHLKFQRAEKSIHIKKKFAQHFKEIIAELHKPLLIRVGSTIYEWKEGLVQGYKLSPALSELYYSYMDEIYLKDYMRNTKSLKLFIRVVDDFLYITESMEDAHSFLEAFSNYQNVNYEKTLANFPHQYIKFSNTITFLGYSYDTTNLNVSRANNIYSGQMCYKISFSNAIVNIYKFLENRIGLSGIQISNHIFNLRYNNEKSVWEHIFITLCLAANKFCTILAILCNEFEVKNYFSVYKKKVTVKLCNCIVETLLRNKPDDFIFAYCINHLRFLSYKALLLCSKITPKCSRLVPVIKSELAKSNCIFGKWRDHGRIISSDGKICEQAVREICRRPDLKIMMKNFDTLPDGFECYIKER